MLFLVGIIALSFAVADDFDGKESTISPLKFVISFSSRSTYKQEIDEFISEEVASSEINSSAPQMPAHLRPDFVNTGNYQTMIFILIYLTIC